MKHLISYALIVCLLANWQIIAQQRQFEIVASTATAEMAALRIPGAAVVIVSRDKAIFSQGFGLANIETGTPITTDTLFRIGSMTKMFTALALMTLVEQGKVKLDDPTGKYLPGMTGAAASVTIRQLLNHTSGIRDEGRPYGSHDEAALLTAAKAIDDSYFFTGPGKVFSYSNLNYLLVGAIVESVSGRPFADAMDALVFKPVGMNKTTFRPTLAMTLPLSQGHQARGNSTPVIVRPFTDNVAGWPAGFLFTTASDLSRFAIAFLNGGIIDGKQALSATAIEALSSGTVEIPGIGVRYGFGLRSEKVHGLDVVGHGGAIPGFGAEIVMSKSNKAGFIVMTNSSAGRLPKTLAAAMEVTLKLQPQEQAGPTPTLSMTRNDLSDIPGIYVHSQRQSFEIVLREGKLLLKDEDELTPITKIASDHFQMASPGQNEPEDIIFVRGASGTIEYLHINGRAFKRKP